MTHSKGKIQDINMKVEALMRAMISQSEAIKAITEVVNKVTENQNNLNRRLEELENRQDPLAHNPPYAGDEAERVA